MGDRRQGDRREKNTLESKKIVISLKDLIFGIVIFVIICLSLFIVFTSNKIGYNKGYNDGYLSGYEDAEEGYRMDYYLNSDTTVE